MKKVHEGEIDLLLASVYMTADRTRYITFSYPIAFAELAFVRLH